MNRTCDSHGSFDCFSKFHTLIDPEYESVTRRFVRSWKCVLRIGDSWAKKCDIVLDWWVFRIDTESNVEIDIKLDVLSEHKEDIVEDRKKCFMIFLVL